MINHSTAAARVEVMRAGQSLVHIYIDRKLVASASAGKHTNGRWILTAGENKIDVTGIFYNRSDLEASIRLFVADPERVQAVWPESGRRTECLDAISALTSRSRKVGAIEDLPESVANEIEELGEDGSDNTPGSI